MWEEVYPHLKCEVPQWRGALHDSKNGFLLQFGVEMVSKVWSFNGGFNGEEEEEKSNVGRGRKSFFWNLNGEREFGFYFKKIFSFLFLKAMPHVSFWVEQKGPTFSLDVTSYSAARREKFYLLNAKSLSRFACRFSGFSPSRFSALVEASFRK